MKNNIGILITTLIIGGCASTKVEKAKVEKEYSHLSVTHNEIQSSKWSQLNRFPARYPKQAVMKSIEGCATIEYVITPQNEVKDITVIASTNKYFSKAAEGVIKNWKWSDFRVADVFDHRAGRQCVTKTQWNHISEESPRSGEFWCP